MYIYIHITKERARARGLAGNRPTRRCSGKREKVKRGYTIIHYSIIYTIVYYSILYYIILYYIIYSGQREKAKGEREKPA